MLHGCTPLCRKILNDQLLHVRVLSCVLRHQEQSTSTASYLSDAVSGRLGSGISVNSSSVRLRLQYEACGSFVEECRGLLAETHLAR